MEDSNRWQQVAKNYVWYLRFDNTVLIALLAIFVGLSWFWDRIPHWVTYSAGGALLAIWLILVLLWAPRRYRVTRYRLDTDRVHFQLGAWWRKEISVTHNRLQHIEIQQGPVERILKISRVILYTAGGTGADLVIPGLPLATSEAIRNDLMQEISAEVVSDESITSAVRDSDDTLPSADLPEDIQERSHDR